MRVCSAFSPTHALPGILILIFRCVLVRLGKIDRKAVENRFRPAHVMTFGNDLSIAWLAQQGQHGDIVLLGSDADMGEENRSHVLHDFLDRCNRL